MPGQKLWYKLSQVEDWWRDQGSENFEASDDGSDTSESESSESSSRSSSSESGSGEEESEDDDEEEAACKKRSLITMGCQECKVHLHAEPGCWGHWHNGNITKFERPE
eukprot:jgi/Mesvir1/10585/Mv21800-RA.1